MLPTVPHSIVFISSESFDQIWNLHDLTLKLGIGVLPGLGIGVLPGLGIGVMPGLGIGVMPGLGIGVMPGQGIGVLPGLWIGVLSVLEYSSGVWLQDLYFHMSKRFSTAQVCGYSTVHILSLGPKSTAQVCVYRTYTFMGPKRSGVYLQYQYFHGPQKYSSGVWLPYLSFHGSQKHSSGFFTVPILPCGPKVLLRCVVTVPIYFHGS